MYDDIIKKNKLIPYFKGRTNDTQLILTGKSVEKQVSFQNWRID